MMVYEQEKETILPELKEGEGLNLVEVLPRQHFTQPPPRYNEASLVKALEEKGIGRPSTYAQIIETIKERGYVKKERRGSKAFIPTELGIIVNDILIKNFPDIMDIGFTAKMEDELDEIEQGKIEWLKVVKDFYLPFSKSLAKAKENIKAEAYRFREETDIVCPACGNKMLLRQSKFGKFLACSTFPQCKEKKQVEIINGEIKIKEPEYIPDEVCELCKGKLLIRESRFGKFIACSNYPRCKFKKVYNPNGKENNQDN
jgi:DNA topoisomerase-1